MSVHDRRAVTTKAREDYASHTDPDVSAFVDMVQRDGDICNNCFRLTSITEERNYYVTTYYGDLWVKKVSRPDRRWVVDAIDYDGDSGRFPICPCGVVDGTIRPQRLPMVMDNVERLMNRLDEKAVDVDRNALRRAAWRLARDPDMQGKQDSIYERLVAHAMD